jgi:hypothetical protein
MQKSSSDAPGVWAPQATTAAGAEEDILLRCGQHRTGTWHLQSTCSGCSSWCRSTLAVTVTRCHAGWAITAADCELVRCKGCVCFEEHGSVRRGHNIQGCSGACRIKPQQFVVSSLQGSARCWHCLAGAITLGRADTTVINKAIGYLGSFTG